MCKFLETKMLHTTAYHPAANAMVERVYRTVKTALKCNDNSSARYKNLGLVLFGVRSMSTRRYAADLLSLHFSPRYACHDNFLVQ